MTIMLSDLKTPTVSAAGLRALDLIGSENFNIDELVEIINTDAMLSGVLIKYANAPSYRRYTEVRSVKNAINILGASFVRGAIMIASMRAYVEPMSSSKELIWERTLSTLLLAKLIAQYCCRELLEDIELTAIMHDIGAMVWCCNFPDKYAEILQDVIVRQMNAEELELEVFGVNRYELTQYIAAKLRLPELTKSTLERYYSAEENNQVLNDVDKHAAILSLARLIEKNLQAAGVGDNENLQLMQNYQLLISLSDDRFDQVVDEYNDKINEFIKM